MYVSLLDLEAFNQNRLAEFYYLWLEIKLNASIQIIISGFMEKIAKFVYFFNFLESSILHDRVVSLSLQLAEQTNRNAFMAKFGKQ